MITVTVDDEAYEVVYKYHPHHRGLRDSLGGKWGAGPPLEPDEDESIEIVEVTLNDEIISFDPELSDRLETAIWFDLESGLEYNED